MADETVPLTELPPLPRVFISHASEDKQLGVENLVSQLDFRGVPNWYDAYEIRPGQSIRQQIDKGLLDCDYGVVILSPTYFEKVWTLQEFDALWNLMSSTGRLDIKFH